MDAKQQAKIWRAAARVVGGMNTMGYQQSPQILPPGAQYTQCISRTYSTEDAAANHAYDAAARVLTAIAQELDMLTFKVEE